MKNEFFKRAALIALLALVVSLAVQVFQLALNFVIGVHAAHGSLVWLLPIAWIFFWLTTLPKWGKDFETTDQILREVETPNRAIRGSLAPLIFVRTLWSHLFGASVGREGTALQIAGSLADTFSRVLKLPAVDRQVLLRAGLAAGLASAYRTPFAGFLFALELGGQPSHREKIECLIASFVAFGLTLAGLSPAAVDVPQLDFTWDLLLDPRLWLVVGALILISPLYKILLLSFARVIRGLGQNWRWGLGGILGLGLFILWSPDNLQGLGTSMIDASFSEPAASWIFLKKIVTTVVFCGTGWFGGDFTPNMAIGASAGQSLSLWLGFSLPALGAAVGLFLPVAFTHRILVTGWVMTMEYFGWQVALIAAPAYFGAWVLHRVLDKYLFARLRRAH